MRLVFAEPAARDLDDIIRYIALDNPNAAAN
jgi:plasmid stabilization system protein ParE